MTYRTIGEVAAAVGVSPQTLRVWESQGLLVPDRSGGGQRRYTDEHLARALRIADLRRSQGWNPAAIRTSLAQESAAAGGKRRWDNRSIRNARRASGLTLKQLAEMVGVSPAHLGAVERGDTGVSTQLIMRIADALLVPPSALATFRARGTTVVRRDERARGLFAGGVVWEELTLPGYRMESSLLTVPPGEASHGAYARPGESFVFVLAGRLRFTLPEAEEIVLVEGDSIILTSHTPFAWENPGQEPARVLWVEQLEARAWEHAKATNIVRSAPPDDEPTTG
ncbi:MerR family transcriptional regulator [Nonomuraea spiralis]|uniref:MerR family transcriptional regulator n=1 Tax=Nonomuraea spiralis TaxID=46182 RepID=A0ABV5ITF7_9ACTN|nr:MerR family transcriptional regulator [Nonomuraea spiralis]GGT30489.1 MerR family transcriptional regulator [Nonomuraea spiralis]